jgi:hypothetical protein
MANFPKYRFDVRTINDLHAHDEKSMLGALKVRAI